MTYEEQNKLWNDLSKEQRQYQIKNYKKYLENVEDHNKNNRLPQTMFNKGMIAILEEVFGEHNLKPMTYGAMIKELFKNGAWQVAGREYPREFVFNEGANDHYFLNCTSEEQGQKLLAINKLLNVAKFLNKNENGSDWVPDFSDTNQKKWYLNIDYNFDKKGKIRIDSKINFRSEIVYFRTEEIARQAVQILEEDVIRTALGNY